LESRQSPSGVRRYATASHLRLFAATAVAVLLIISLLPSYRDFAAPMDEGALLVYPERIAKGQLPYRDFETFYGPANLYLLSAFYSVFGTTITVERTVGLGYRLLLLAAVFGISRRWGIAVAVGCVAVTGALLANLGIVAYTWIGSLVCALVSIWLIAEPENRRRCFFGGLLAATGTLFRPDFAPAIILATAPLFLLMPKRCKAGWLAGGIAVSVPFAALVWNAGLQLTIENVFVYPVFQSAGRHLPLASAQPNAWHLLYAHIAASGTNLAAGICSMRANRRSSQGRLLLAIAILPLLLTHQAMQRMDAAHVLSAACISVGMLPLSIAVLISRCRIVIRDAHACFATAITALVVIFWLPHTWSNFRVELADIIVSNPDRSVFVEHGGRLFPFQTKARAKATAHLLAQVESLSHPGERLFVGPADLRRTNYNDTFLYHMLPKLRAATYFLEMNPGSANRTGSRLAADVRSADWLILNRVWDGWNEPNASRDYGSNVPNEVVQNEYGLRGEFGAYRLYQRKKLDNRAQPPAN
jgi:hypothetical protein